MASGLYLGDLEPGTKMKGRVGRRVTDADNVWFTLLTNNGNQFHFDAEYTRRNFPGKPFRGRMVVNGFFTLATVAGIMVEQTSSDGFMLGLDRVKFSRPVFSGDTIYDECEVLGAGESRSGMGSGIVSVKTRGYDQRGETVVEFEREFMVRKGGSKGGRTGGGRERAAGGIG